MSACNITAEIYTIAIFISLFTGLFGGFGLGWMFAEDKYKNE